MTATMAKTRQITRRVVIGGREYDKPWDPSCGACRSPWLAQIDAALAEGYSLRQLRKFMAGYRPAIPNEQILRAHIAHLADPHRKARLAFEEAAEARGDDTTSSPAQLSDALQAIVRTGVENLTHGDLEIQARDMLAAMKLLVQLEAQRNGEGVEAPAWQAAFMEFFEIVRKHMNPGQWKAFTADVYASPAIRAVLAEQSPALPGETG
jgi:hypothetical protein